MARVRVELDHRTIVLEDLGPLMTSEFVTLYHEAFGSIDWRRHNLVSSSFMVQRRDFQGHDQYFNNLTILWQMFVKDGRLEAAARLWIERIMFALEWESSHPPARIHKGTPFYFLGVTYLLSRNLEHGLLSMHRALDEDVRTHRTRFPDTPAYAFVTLNSRKTKQFFRPWVQELSREAQAKLARYRRGRHRRLTVSALRRRFLSKRRLRELAFYFVSSIARAREFEKGSSHFEGDSEFGALMRSRVLFDLCLVSDGLLAARFPRTQGFPNRLHRLALGYRIRNSLQTDLKTLNQGVQNNGFEATLQAVWSRTFLGVTAQPLTALETDIALAYLIRNHGAHSLKVVALARTHFAELLQRMLNVLFLVVEASPR